MSRKMFSNKVSFLRASEYFRRAEKGEVKTVEQNERQKRGASFTAKRIAFDAMFAAMFFVFSSFCSINVSPFKFTLDGIVIIVCCFSYGLADGIIVALCGSFFSQLLLYGFSVTTPIWMLAPVSRALICGLAAVILKYKFTVFSSSLIIILSSLVVTAFNTLALYLDALILGYLYSSYITDVVLGALLYRVLASLITAVLYCIITPPIIKSLRRAHLAKTPLADI